MDIFENYNALLRKVDQRCLEISGLAGEKITCKRGCDDCCRHIGLFAVEAISLAMALARLSAAEIRAIREDAESATGDGPCPLLKDHECRLYEARPIICRTHGFPVLVPSENGDRIDCCPLNFDGGVVPDPGLAISVDSLNQMLVAVNRLFLSETGLEGSLPERVSVADALLMDIDMG